VLVLDKGRVLEYASPLELIEDEQSAFRSLCMAQGKEEFDELLAMARIQR
jgi:ABC-type multidrug transport system fused ATPase/permease subunit